jgi:Spy/CpxP family protein refolding chaperone
MPLLTARADSPPASSTQQPPAPPAQGSKTQGAKSDAGDIVQLVDGALAGIDLRPDQKDALQKLGADVDDKVGAVDQAKRDFLLVLAKQIGSGTVDKDALQPRMQAVEQAAAAASPDVRTAFQKMHDILDADQRKQFVSNFKDELMKDQNDLDPKTQLDKVSQTLSLTDDQKQKVAGILESDQGADDKMHKRIETVLDAFPSDTFSIDHVLPVGSVQDRTRKVLGRIADNASQITDILTPEQRTTAADAITSKVSRSSAGGSTTGTSSSSLEVTGSASEPLWAGRGYGARGYGVGGYAFSGGYGTGYGGAYLF